MDNFGFKFVRYNLKMFAPLPC